jgi:hypothetical protein
MWREWQFLSLCAATEPRMIRFIHVLHHRRIEHASADSAAPTRQEDAVTGTPHRNGLLRTTQGHEAHD